MADYYAFHAGSSDAASPSAGIQSDDDDDLVIINGPAAKEGHEDDDVVSIGEPEVSQAAVVGTLPQAEGNLSKRSADGDIDGPRKRQRGA